MKETISTDKAPQAIGPYSQAVACDAGKLVFLSGQIPLNPSTMKIESEDIHEQTKQVLENLKAVLSAAQCSLEHVVKTTIYLADMNDFATVNEVYADYFGQSLPARATVEVSRLPKDVRVEIDAVAVR